MSEPNDKNGTGAAPGSKLENMRLTGSLDSDIDAFKTIFSNNDMLVVRYVGEQNASTARCCILFFEGMADEKVINESIIKPLMAAPPSPGSNTADILMDKVISAHAVRKLSAVDTLVEAVLNGDTLLFVDGSNEALSIGSKTIKTRAIEEPEAEKVIRGPREGFTESLILNLALLRRKLLTQNFKLNLRTMGRQTRTKVCICYIEGIANTKILEELQKRLDEIDIDGILDSNYIQELIKDAPLSPFKTIGNSERPDIVAAKLLEGRIALLVDGTPIALTLPHIFIEYFQTNDDYYLSLFLSTINRLLRVFGFLLTIGVPAIYLALITFHQEMIQTSLILSIASARQGMPFPTLIEALALLIVFDLLREAGTRMPTYIGQSLSIVGALVIGQAAVEARFVSAPMVIVVALSGITGLIIPKLKGAVIFLRVTFLFLASFLGLYGYIFGMAGLLIHLFELRTFGVPYMYGLMSLNIQDLKDTAIRMPWWYMKYRPGLISGPNRIRQRMRKKKN